MAGLVGFEVASPFHDGETRVQTALGVRDQIEPWARRVVRDFLPDEHADFYAQLPFLVAAARDRSGRPWATLLVGDPGFISAPNSRTLSIDASISKLDALASEIEEGSDLGMLGIELHSRRRNRVNGRVRSASAKGIQIEVDQTFGNCPQHIRPRAWRAEKALNEAGDAQSEEDRSEVLSPEQRQAIESADTFFIASGYSDSTNAGDETPRDSSAAPSPTHGMDVSHRGGPRGFVEVESDRVLVIPDYAGNNHFNTVGNLVVDSRAGLLFVDFETGSLLQLTGHGEIDWSQPDSSRYPGAKRLIRFTIEEVVAQAAVVPIRWSEPEEGAREFRLARRIQESEDVVSFHFEPTDGEAVPDWRPGQHLPVELDIEGGNRSAAIARTYSLSNAPDSSEYRISVKREPEGRVSRHLHDRLRPGSIVRANEPAGSFALSLDEIEPGRPILLVAAGIGITPLVAMLHAIATERPDQEVVLVHGVRDGAHHPLADEVRTLIQRLPRGRLHVRYSQPISGDLGDSPGDGGGSRGSRDQGRVDVDLLKQLVQVESAEVFLCGPAGFMAAIESDLEVQGAAPSRIHYETF